MAKQTASRAKAPAARGKGASTAADARMVQGASDAMPTHDEIARRAFELYVTRGCFEGDEVHDWLRAEAELRGARA